MPKFINVIPKVGETVKIAVFDYRNKKIRREYIGPVIVQQRPPDLIKLYDYWMSIEKNYKEIEEELNERFGVNNKWVRKDMI